MKSKVVERMLSEISEETKQKVRDMANDMVKKNEEKTTDADMTRMFEYMDKMGVQYTVNRNPSVEEIARIKAAIKRNQIIRTYSVRKV